MVSPQLEKVINRAIGEAKRRRHEFVSLEHMLFALCQDEGIGEIIHACGGRVQDVVEKIDNFFAEEALPVFDGVGEVHPTPTRGFRRVIHMADWRVQSASQL